MNNTVYLFIRNINLTNEEVAEVKLVNRKSFKVLTVEINLIILNMFRSYSCESLVNWFKYKKRVEQVKNIMLL